MSDCGCGGTVGYGGVPWGVNPCGDGCPPNTADNETLGSALQNFILAFFGSLTKTDDGNGNVSWQLPCDLGTGIPGNPRLDGEGVACYLLRLLQGGVTGLNGTNSFARTVGNFVQPAVSSTVFVTVDTAAPFAVGQYVWGENGGFYFITAVAGSVLTLQNLVAPPANLGAGGTVSSGTRIFVSGPAALPGPTGATGATGAAGTNSYLYIAFASDNLGTNFSLNPTTTTNAYIAFKISPTVIASPGPADFVGVSWARFVGPAGPTGAMGPSASGVPQSWTFKAPGSHSWVAPATGVTQVRVRVYGAGGGGGGGSNPSLHGNHDGQGGGGGEFSQGVITIVPGRQYWALVGTGGTANPTLNSEADGTAGGDTKFLEAGVSGTVFLVAKGGGGGATGALGSTYTNGGTGGSGTTTPEVPNQPGLVGGFDSALPAGDLRNGGHCGRLGGGGIANDGTSNPGEEPGGGGGGGWSGGPGGAGGAAGANGRVEIEVVS